MEKTFLSLNRRANLNKKQVDLQNYMDKMDEALHKNILENSRPYWRDHCSQKGKLNLL